MMYKNVYEQDELYHYGIKGMKWGVRREIGKKSKTAAYLERQSAKEGETLLKAIKKRDKANSYGYTNEANDYDQVVKTSISRIKKMHNLRNKLVSDMSEKDIKKGRSALAGLGGGVGAVTLGVGIPVAFAGNNALNKHRAKKFANNYGMEDPFSYT